MYSIWKFQLDIRDSQNIEVPVGCFRPLSVQFQGCSLCLWAVVTPSESKTFKTIRIFGTGHPMEDSSLQFVDTVQDGSLVWHVFVE